MNRLLKLKRKSAAHRILTLVLVVVVTAVGVLPGMVGYGENSSEILIYTVDDIKKLSSDCTLDTWSKGKTVRLMNDIDLSDSGFAPIPTFGGYFDGGGYTIVGLNITNSGSQQGLFRYVQSGGTVENLHVLGNITPSGSKSTIGGIVGDNSGVINNCSFDGTVSGSYAVGGIVGINRSGASIISCKTYGTVNCESFAGGVSGKNSGFIRECENNSSVNTVQTEKKTSIGDISTDVGTAIEKLQNSENDNKNNKKDEEGIFPSYSDTGGICGYSDGIIQGSDNRGAIGYQHMGYNVGGIVGRQSGYIIGCENYADVHGRKDVGGICGQSEPYMILSVSGHSIDSLTDEVNKLHTLINNMAGDIDGSSDDISARFKDLTKDTDAVRDSAKELSDSVSGYFENDIRDFINDNIDEVNAKAAILTEAADGFADALDKTQEMTDKLTEAIDIFGEAIDMINPTTPDLESANTRLQKSLDEMAAAARSFRKAAAYASNAVYNLRGAIVSNDSEKMSQAFKDILSAVQKMSDENKKMQEAVDKIQDILSEPGVSRDKLDRIKKATGELSNALVERGKALVTVVTSLDTILKNSTIDFDAVRRAGDQLEKMSDSLQTGMSKLSSAMTGLSGAIDIGYDVLKEYADNTTADIEKICDKMKEGSDKLSEVSDMLGDISGMLEKSIRIITDAGSVNFVKLNDDYKLSTQKLFDSLSDVSNGVSDIEQTFKSSGEKLTARLREINDQMNVIMNILSDEADEIKDKTDRSDSKNIISDYVDDVSEEDIKNTKQGKIDSCLNHAKIEADRNTGGICGVMAIEYSADPETDIERPSTINFTYKSKAVLYRCVNDGKVIGKKDDIGGVCGRIDLGTVQACESYSEVESTDGNYVGGVAGYNNSSVRGCFSKGSAKGKTAVGGIVGRAGTLTKSYSIGTVSGDEKIGAVCGENSDLSAIGRNRYVADSVGGIDGISYSGHAEPITYDELVNISGIPKRFISFKIKFVADGTVLKETEVEYKTNVSDIRLPDIPPKDDGYGVWPDFPDETVMRDVELNAEYKPWITTLESKEKDDDGELALGLAEGKFDDRAALTIDQSPETPAVEPKRDEYTRVYKISLSGSNVSGTSIVPIRLINKDKRSTTVWHKEGDGSWKEVSSSERGKYIKLEMTGTDNTFCVLYSPRSRLPLIFGGIALVLAAVAIIIFRRRIKAYIKKRKNAVGRTK